MAPRFDISTWPIAHQDARRILREKPPNEDGIVMTGFEILSADLPLGNHYHARKAEVFYVLKGSSVWTLQYLQVVDGKVTQIGDRVTLTVQAGDFLTMPPFVAHTVILTVGAEMACINTEPFDPADLVPYKLL